MAIEDLHLTEDDLRGVVWFVDGTRRERRSRAGRLGRLRRQVECGQLPRMGRFFFPDLLGGPSGVSHRRSCYRYRLPGGTPACRTEPKRGDPTLDEASCVK